MAQGAGQMATCVARAWSPGIGDPSPFAWAIVGVYALAAILAFLVALRRPFPAGSWRRERAFWLLVSLAMTALAVNKQLDLQSLLTSVGRCMAQIQGWYDERRRVQVYVIIGLGLAAIILCLFSAYGLRGTLRRSGLPMLGLFLVAGFVMIRAAGFHHVDALINYRFAEMKVNWLLEIPGPILISACAIWLLACR